MYSEKKQFYENKIILLLLEKESMTIKEIAETLMISEKGCRNKIDDINDILKEKNLGVIVKKPRVGIWLDATREQRETINYEFADSHKKRPISNSGNRIGFALKHILNISRGNELSTQQLSNLMYLSLPTTLKVIKECKEWLKLFNIELKLIRNKGIILNYTEETIRFAIKHYIFAFQVNVPIMTAIGEFTPGLNLELVKKVIVDAENKWGLEFTDQSFNEVFIYSAIALYRNINSLSTRLSISKDEEKIIEEYSEYAFSETIYSRLNQLFSIRLSNRECIFLAIQILCSRIIDVEFANDSIEQFRKYDEKLREFVKKIIKVVSNVLNKDFTSDSTLFHGLLIHIRPTIFRLRYEKKHSNEMYEYVRTEYKQTYRVSWLISVLFEEYYNLQVSSDEISFITLYIQSAIERSETEIDTVLVSQQAMAVNQLLIEKIKQYCPGIKDITPVSAHDFQLSHYPDTGLILTTTPIESGDSRIIHIEPFLKEKSLQNLNHKIRTVITCTSQRETNFDSICHTFFEPDLIFTHLKIDDKESLLTMLCHRLERKGYVTDQYVKTVLERESAVSTSIGNNVAIPHGDQNEINHGKVVIVTLEKPILWSGIDEVDVIFLLSVRMKTDFEIQKTQQFYKQYIKLVDSDQSVEILRKFKSSAEFYKYLVR